MSLTIRADAVSLGYPRHQVISDLTLELPAGKVTAIVGPNACGKSTLLRGLARLHPLESGTVSIATQEADGQAGSRTDIGTLSRKQLATLVAMLPQTSVAPDGVRVAELVSRGRFPHQGWFGRHGSDDDAVVQRSMEATGVADLADRRLEELSGGQRQRVWIAMVLAQQTDAVLLDEPTTYLDVTHQLDLLDLLRELNAERGTTIVMVLHELNYAARYADHMVVMAAGKVVGEGRPGDVLTEQAIADAFDLDAAVISDPVTGGPLVVPRGARREARGARSRGQVATSPPGK